MTLEEIGRSMAQVAINWAANRPSVSSVLIGSTNVNQLKDNLQALDFVMPEDLQNILDTVSMPETTFPYSFFADSIQGMINRGGAVGGKPATYFTRTLGKAAGAGVGAKSE